MEDTESQPDYLNSFVIIPEDDPVEDFELVNYQADSSDEEEVANLFIGFRPIWIPDEQRTTCQRCECAFSFIKRSNNKPFLHPFFHFYSKSCEFAEHHCRFCGEIFCYFCCNMIVSFPPWFGYEKPQKVCEKCLPNLFESRRETTGAIGSANHKLGEDHLTYYTFGSASNEIISSSLRFLSPVCQYAFWWSGMYEGGKFNRNYIESAASLKIPFTLDPVKSITRLSFPVPGDSADYSLPVVIFTPLIGHAPYPILVGFFLFPQRLLVN